MKEKVLNALKKLKEGSEKRSFIQGIDLVINLRDIDLRKTPLSIFFSMPHKMKEPKICGFLEQKSTAVDRAITKGEMTAMDKDAIKTLAKEYDFFLASAPLMGPVATVFGKVLGPLGKMPNPKTHGVIMVENEENIKSAVATLRGSTNIKVKEPSVKISVGKEDMDESKVVENILAVYAATIAMLPNRKDNVKSILIKLSMSKPQKVEME